MGRFLTEMRLFQQRFAFLSLALPVLGLLPLPVLAQPAAGGVEFFESRIRPVLAEKCYACHSAKTMASSELRVDSQDGLLRGGSRGPAVVPGDIDNSLLIRAVSYADPKLAMPPTGKLSNEAIADLEAWIAMGAPDPRGEVEHGPKPEPATVAAGDLWSLQPFQKHPWPELTDQHWPKTMIDGFLLAKLEQAGLKPAPLADKLTLLRRVSFDLAGLPPTAGEIEDFLADDSAQAFEKVVDRLLASPHYGERWARHWLDLARFAETNGHEFDQEKPDAWRYRDYVIRAFNQDLPYDRFIREQLAADLLPAKRLVPEGTHFDSPLATGFYGLGEERNAADDVAEVRADKVDNQIDVIGRTFLGLTLACARCHDHKFDPVGMDDYYALAGILHSSQIIQGNIDSPARARELQRIRVEMEEIDGQMRQITHDAARSRADQLSPRLFAAVKLFLDEKAEIDSALDRDAVEQFAAALGRAEKEFDHVLYPLAALARTAKDEESSFKESLDSVRSTLAEWKEKSDPGHSHWQERGDDVFEDFESNFSQWQVHGEAFGKQPSSLVPHGLGLSGYQGSNLASSFAGGSNTFVGALNSKSFRVRRKYMHVRMAGFKDKTHGRQPGEARIELWSDGRFAHVTGDDSGAFHWQSQRLSKQDGELAFFQIIDRSPNGHIVVDRIVLSDSSEPPEVVSAPNTRLLAALSSQELSSLEEVVNAYQQLFQEALGEPQASRESRWIVNELSVDSLPEKDEKERLGELEKRRRALERVVPDSAFGMLCVEDQPRDTPIHLRGDHNHLGKVVPRGFLSVLNGGERIHFDDGSGRRQLADAVAGADNPLTARVMVNRVWQHHFGSGLVRTPDNFGMTGERPSHPELLDTLAATFVENGWSLKKLHRVMVLSSAYQMSSRADERALAADGENRLLHHFPVRRLEAEVVRDAILAATGALDRNVHGPSVPPFISPYQDGRGKPESGPLDGGGRRSIYIGVRRNFISPLFLAFDYPMTVTTIGRRMTSTVPSQALILMNNEFVARQAEKWADRLIAEHPEARPRVQTMFLGAFQRPVTEDEIERVSAFLKEQAENYENCGPDDQRIWTDLAHALINSKEFVFIR